MSETLIGATTAVFPVRLSVAVASPVDVEWSTRDGSAIAGTDYKAASGTVTFLPGETEKQIEVQVYGQAITPADDKKFFIRLNPPSNAVLVDAILTCTINIIDDHGVPSVAVVVAEGRRGPKGDPGLSAYEQAVLMGYTGSVEEWMEQIANASQAADRAQGYSNTAAEEALKAQNAARNAVFAGVIFPTAAEGVDPILGVQNGAYFNVRSPLSEHYINEYQNVNGVAVATGKSYPTANYVSDGLNTCAKFVETIAELVAIQNPREGQVVFVKGYHAPDLFIELKPYKGGGNFVWSATSTATPDNGIVFAVSGITTGRWIRLNKNQITPELFGSKGNGSYDDRPAFQSAVNYLWNNRGGEVFVPTPLVEYRWKSFDSTHSTCLYIPESKRGPYVDPICLRGEGKLNMIKVDLSASAPAGIKSAIKFGGFGHYRAIENLSVWGGVLTTVPYVDYVLSGSEDNYSPDLTLRNLQFYVAKVDCIKISTYVAKFTQVKTAYSPRGLVVIKPDPQVAAGTSGPCTAITFDSCYGLEHTKHAFWGGELTYCTFNSYAADHIISPDGSYEAYPYYIDIARGVTFNAMGAESSSRILRVRVAQGLTINGIMTLSIGKVADGQPAPNHLIRIDGGYSATIGGMHLQNPFPFTYKLSLGNTFARECVVITDESIEPNEATYTVSPGREKPIVFLVNQKLKRALSFTLTNTGNATTNTANMRTFAAYSYDRELNYTLTINLPSGDFLINDAVSLANAGTNGYARIILKGNADGTSRIVCTSAGRINFGLPSTLARLNYTLDNVTIHADTTITAGTRLVDIQNANVYFIKSKLTSHNGAVQYAITSDSKIILDANSSIKTPAVSSGIVEYTYKATAAPTTSTRLPVGTIFRASDPNDTRIGWINIADNGVNWVALNISNPSGTTANRPTTGVYVGYQYFDTTLGKPIFVKTTSPIVWVDAVGTTV